MKKLLFSILIFLSACMTYANTNIADIIKNMPKEFLPYINDNMRAELVNSIKNGDTINISSMLEETIAIDSISADFIRMRATKTTTIQLRLLDVSDSTTIICMVKTFEVPICESKISFFSTSWSLLSEDYGLPTFNDNTTTLDSLTFKPEDMNEDKKFQKMYEKLMDYESSLHEINQKRIKIGLRCIYIIPLIFLVLLFITDSSKIIFLVLWIASLFGIAIYLIGVEYVDYKLQEKMNEIGGKNDIEPESLITIEQVSQKVAGVVGKIEETKEEVKL